MQLQTVWFCPNCGSQYHQHNAAENPHCCPDSAMEFVTQQTADYARAGFLHANAIFAAHMRGEDYVIKKT